MILWELALECRDRVRKEIGLRVRNRVNFSVKFRRLVQALAYAEFRNKRDSMTFPVHYLFFPAPSTPFLLSPFLSLFSLPINPAKDLRRRSQSQTPLHGHRLRTPPTDELTTILQQICLIAMPEPNISTCQDVGMWQIFVRCWCSLVDGGVFVAGVRSRCPCSGVLL